MVCIWIGHNWYVVGGITTGYFALKSTKKAYDNQVKRAAQNESKLIRGVLQAIHDEIETVFERYEETMGAMRESLKEREPLLIYYPLVSDSFER